MMFVPCSSCPPSFSGYALVVPSVSVGNVAQLATDLLIQNMNLQRVGFMQDDSFLPVVGNNPYSSEPSLMTAVEVYSSLEKKVVIIQQRSPVIKSKKLQFVEKLLQWITASKFQSVSILTSSFSDERRDSQLTGTQLRYLFSQSLKESETSFIEKENWQELEKRIIETNPADSIYMPGCGVAKEVYLKCLDASIPTAVLLIFCSEGDNAGEALELASYFNSWKSYVALQDNLKSTGGWKLPPSWRLLYGSRFTQTLFQ